jgi:hypothetical protein
MTNENFKHSFVVTKAAKILAWIAVILLNIYFIYFSVIQGMSRSLNWQRQYSLACIIQFIVEIIFNETGECLWIHYMIPKIVIDEVAATVASVHQAIDIAFQKEKIPPILDSAKHFFVSRRVAEQYPSLFESSVVLSFYSYFPPSELDATVKIKNNEINKHEVPVTRQKYALSFLFRFNLTTLLWIFAGYVGSLPIRIQQIIIHTLQPILLSFILVFFYYLREHPFIALFLIFFSIYEILFIIYRALNKRSRTLPAIIDAGKNAKSMETFVREYIESKENEESDKIILVENFSSFDSDSDSDGNSISNQPITERTRDEEHSILLEKKSTFQDEKIDSIQADKSIKESLYEKPPDSNNFDLSSSKEKMVSNDSDDDNEGKFSGEKNLKTFDITLKEIDKVESIFLITNFNDLKEEDI